MEVAQALDDSGSAKRRKVAGNGELRLPSSKPVRITGRDGEDVVNSSKKESSTSGEISSISGDIPVTCCSIDASITEKLKFADLEESAEIENETETETETTVRGRRESLPLQQIKTHPLSPNLMANRSGFTAKSGKPESVTTEKPPVLVDPRRTVPPEKTPPAAELEEFFAAAEKNLQNRFKNKYNYDVVNDVPLKGRYEWIQLK